MNEVRIFDGSGNLKEVVSVKTLAIRTEKQFEFPYLFLKNKKKPGRPSAKSSENQEKAEVQYPIRGANLREEPNIKLDQRDKFNH